MAAKPRNPRSKQVPSVGSAGAEVFIDTSGFFALLSAADPAHARAREQMAATALFLKRLDQGFSLTDCVSFTVMERGGLHEALTTDHHFQIAGFMPLL